MMGGGKHFESTGPDTDRRSTRRKRTDRIREKATSKADTRRDEQSEDTDDTKYDCSVCGDGIKSKQGQCKHCSSKLCNDHHLPADHDCPEVDYETIYERTSAQLFGDEIRADSPAYARRQFWRKRMEHEPFEPIEGKAKLGDYGPLDMSKLEGVERSDHEDPEPTDHSGESDEPVSTSLIDKIRNWF